MGAGLAGATYERERAESSHLIDVIDRRGHIGGNVFCETQDHGIRVHRDGQHLFHTNYERVVEWLRQFGKRLLRTHCVCALRLGSQPVVPLPINRRTINEALP